MILQKCRFNTPESFLISIFQDSLMNTKLERTAFIWNVYTVTFDQFNASLLNKIFLIANIWRAWLGAEAMLQGCEVTLCKLASFVPRSQTTPCCRTQGVCPTVWECVCRRETRPREISHLCLTCLCWSCTQTLFPVSWSKSCLQLTFIILFARSRTFRVSVKTIPVCFKTTRICQ